MDSTTKLLLVSAVAPIAFLLIWTWRRDRLPEPPRVVLATFLLGALTTIPILISGGFAAGWLGVEFPPNTVRDALLTSFILAALIEECFKFAVLSRYSARHSAFDEPYDGIVYGVAASLGFACVENILYVMMLASIEGAPAGFGVALGRALLAVPMHTACGAIMGSCIGIGRSRTGVPSRGWAMLGLLAAILIHGLYDTAILLSGALATDEESLVPLAGLGVAACILLGAWIGTVSIASWLRRQQRR